MSSGGSRTRRRRSAVSPGAERAPGTASVSWRRGRGRLVRCTASRWAACGRGTHFGGCCGWRTRIGTWSTIRSRWLRGGLPAQHHIAARASRDVLIWLVDAQLVGHAQSLNATSGAVAAPQRVQTQGLAHSTALNAYSSQGLHQLPGKNRPDTPCMRRRLYPGCAVTGYEPPAEVASEAGYAVRSMMSLPGWPLENESTKAAGSCSNPGNTDCTASNCPELMSSASVASTSAARSM